MDWFEKSLREEASRTPSEILKPAQERTSSKRERRARRLEPVGRHFCGRIHSMHHGAVLSIAPLEARIALTAHMVPILTQHKNRVMFLFTEDDSHVSICA